MSQTYKTTCPKCAAVYDLPADYVSNYGGQSTQCRTCGGPITIPTAAPPPLPPGGVAVLPYSGPAVHGEGIGVWRDGKTLVTITRAVLPARCVKCNEAVAEPQINRKLRWHNPALALLIFLPLGILIYVVVAICVRKSGYIQLSLCPIHRRRRRNNIIIGWLAAASGVGLIALAIGQQTGIPAIAGSILLVAAAVWAILACGILSPKRIDNQFMWLRGAGKPFLETLPDIPPVPLVTTAAVYPAT
jgi:hypothetical protein